MHIFLETIFPNFNLIWSETLQAPCVLSSATVPSRQLQRLFGTVCRSQFGHCHHCQFSAVDWRPSFLLKTRAFCSVLQMFWLGPSTTHWLLYEVLLLFTCLCSLRTINVCLSVSSLSSSLNFLKFFKECPTNKKNNKISSDMRSVPESRCKKWLVFQELSTVCNLYKHCSDIQSEKLTNGQETILMPPTLRGTKPEALKSTLTPVFVQPAHFPQILLVRPFPNSKSFGLDASV